MRGERVRIAIVGAGFAGMGAAIALLRSGERDFVVLERNPEVGGTWWDNTYPGCRCDVPAHLYSFSFAPNPDWGETYAGQPEIRDYLRRLADDSDIRRHIRFGTEVTGAHWSEVGACWHVAAGTGSLMAQILILVPGRASTGPARHSCRDSCSSPACWRSRRQSRTAICAGRSVTPSSAAV